MTDFFDKLKEYIDAAKQTAGDWAEKGAVALEELAAWIRAQAAAKSIAMSASDAATLATLKADLTVLQATPRAASGGLYGKLIEIFLGMLDRI